MGTLGDYFAILITKQHGIKPEEVTPQFIREQRERFIYPNLRMPAPPGMISLTRNEIERLATINDALLDSV